MPSERPAIVTDIEFVKALVVDAGKAALRQWGRIAHEYKEMPGLDHGSIVMGAMPDVFRFFGEHVKPAPK